jgi:hypothetical protein
MAVDNDKKKPMTITISFKKDEDWLYNKINTHTDKSAWVKETLIKATVEEEYGIKDVYNHNPNKTVVKEDTNSVNNGMGILGSLE